MITIKINHFLSEMYTSNLFNEVKKPFVLDGAVGSFLQSKIDSSNPLWSSFANIEQPEKVINLHQAYINAGANIITTNTFRTNYEAYKKSKLDISYKDFVLKSVELAKKARGNTNVLIAGSNAPAEDCYQVERNISQANLKYNHEKHIELLWESGVDFILNETQSHLDEIEIICKYSLESKIPFAISIYLNNNLELLSGQKLLEVINFIQRYSPLFIGLNCIKDELLIKVIGIIELKFNWGFYLNLGSGDQTSEIINSGVDENEYSEMTLKYLKYNPVVIGACCGSNPSHIKALRKTIDEVY